MISRCFLILVFVQSIIIISENVASFSKKAFIHTPLNTLKTIKANINGTNNNIYILGFGLDSSQPKDEMNKNDSTGSKTDDKCFKPYSVADGIYSNCGEAVRKNGNKTGVYTIKVENATQQLEPFEVYCLADPKNLTAWTIFQRRSDGCVDFFQNWTTYESGFGRLNGEHFLGLKKIYELTQSTHHELWIKLVDWNNETRYARYRKFIIEDEDYDYQLELGTNYVGNVDELLWNTAQYIGFSTFDKDNDKTDINCAEEYKSGWWFNRCKEDFSNLNGQYFENNSHGITWFKWHGMDYSLPYVHMAIRPKEDEAIGLGKDFNDN